MPHIRTDRRAMACLILLTGFSPEFVTGLGRATIRDMIEQIVATTNWDGLARQMELAITLDVREQARRITTPSLIVGCTQDQMVPISPSRQLATLIPGARFVEIDSGHFVPQEKPHEPAGLIRDFL